ncbi:MAG: hypothetical protein IIZ62_00990 [Ruminococcus sp.]|nr:hypothetical protein [Ruminococcus sp.]
MTENMRYRMSEEFDLQKYMTEGVERVVNDAIKATLKNPRESAFMLRFAAASRAAALLPAEVFSTSIPTAVQSLVRFHRIRT